MATSQHSAKKKKTKRKIDTLYLDAEDSRNDYSKHDKVSQTEYPCKFDQCTFVASSREEIVEHNTYDHMRDNQYVCYHCHKEFIRDAELNEHLAIFHSISRRSHNRTGKWTCRFEDCGLAFASRKKLYKHKTLSSHIADASSK